MAGSVAALPTAGETFRMNATRAELPPAESIARDVRRALDEDIGSGDVTADLLPGGAFAQARVVTREAAVLCGAAWFERCFRALDEAVRSGKVQRGQTLLLEAFGGGFTWSSALLKY